MKEIRFNPKDTSKRIFSQHGTSLLEALAYLGIAAVVILGAIALLFNAFNGAASNGAEQAISSMQTGVRKLYAGQPNGYVGLTNAQANSARIIPASLTVNGNNITNQWGGAVALAPGAAAGTFTLTFNTVPQDVCINLMTSAAGWVDVAVNAQAAVAAPITPTQATAACNAAANNMVWTSN